MTKELKGRWKSNTPKFFKNVIAISGTLAAIGTALLAVPGIPVAVATLGGYLITAGGIGAAVAKLTKEDK